ncbi:nuclear transport factor 2 family protein [Novosphingobium sp. M1R2S20]|uniref:Nuclear transport factor 2 family protein n=1 Tax=Novosphingobium rhizovicinum TaxID=3228928 RepID=A0ABV3RDG4_9SPHN
MTQFATAEAPIRQLYAHYADAVWRKDVDAIGQCFTPDAEWRIEGMVLRGRSEIMTELDRSLKGVERTLVNFRTPQLELTGHRRGSGRVYVTEQYAWRTGPATMTVGRYYEYYTDCGDRWRISWRLVQVLYSGPTDMTGTFYEQASMLP